MSDALILSFLVSVVSESLRSLTKMSDHEQFAQVALQKCSLSLRSLRLLRSLTKTSDHEQFAQVALQK